MRRLHGQGDPCEPVRLIEADVTTLAAPRPGLVGDRRSPCEEAEPSRRECQRPVSGREQGPGGELKPNPRFGGRPLRYGGGQGGAGSEVLAVRQKRDLRACLAPIQDQQPRLHTGPVFGEGTRREAATGKDAPPGAQPPHQAFVGQGRHRQDGGQASAIGQGREGRRQMRLKIREWWIADRHVEPAGARQQILDVASVHARPRRRSKQAVEQRRTAIGQFVQRQNPAAGLGHDGDQTRARRGLQHLVAGSDLGSQHHERRQLRRGGELIQRELILGPSAMGQTQAPDRRQEGGDAGGRVLEPRDLGVSRRICSTVAASIAS